MKIKKNFRLTLGYIMGILFLFRAKPTIASLVAGGFFIILGEAIRFVSAGTLKKYKGVVTSNGIYAFTRNPLYIGSFFLGIGACIMGRDPIFLALFAILYIPVYHSVIKREEAFLLKNYGDIYDEYRRAVPRILPRKLDIPYIFRETSPAKSFNNKEGKTLLGLVAVMVVMIAKMIYLSHA